MSRFARLLIQLSGEFAVEPESLFRRFFRSGFFAVFAFFRDRFFLREQFSGRNFLFAFRLLFLVRFLFFGGQQLGLFRGFLGDLFFFADLFLFQLFRRCGYGSQRQCGFPAHVRNGTGGSQSL
jgi:hypothetical protein